VDVLAKHLCSISHICIKAFARNLLLLLQS